MLHSIVSNLNLSVLNKFSPDLSHTYGPELITELGPFCILSRDLACPSSLKQTLAQEANIDSFYHRGRI